MAHGPLWHADVRLDRAVVGSGPRWLTGFLADLGSMRVALPVLAAAVAHALWRGLRAAPLAAVLAMGAVPLLVVPLKAGIDRPAPLDAALSGYYPSGHTATAAVAYGGAALLLHACGHARWPMPVATALSLATGTGLVLHGYHWPLDVVGSGCLGVLLLGPLRWLGRRPLSRPPLSPRPLGRGPLSRRPRA
ncbi:phosphatase PAP2 family protein [Streptomyces sp. NBC_00237]|uniref:phosphatase PAP2 family protein n=1 Tax=Streptomyces sp. NBC_00237 TaxID=2975687 RepID=UPI0022520FE3|nr:phosphatase PAP2 family protein [Streptomyces sp. NBC_00237]